jgi:DNA-binding transcriptional ArsR family regulator
MIFSALANRTRLAIIDTLRDGGKTLSEIAEALEQEETLVEENLKTLVRCAIVSSQDAGTDRLYSLNRELLEPLSELLVFHIDKHCPGYRECITSEKLKEHMKAEAAKTAYIEHE